MFIILVVSLNLLQNTLCLWMQALHLKLLQKTHRSVGQLSPTYLFKNSCDIRVCKGRRSSSKSTLLLKPHGFHFLYTPLLRMQTIFYILLYKNLDPLDDLGSTFTPKICVISWECADCPSLWDLMVTILPRGFHCQSIFKH